MTDPRDYYPYHIAKIDEKSFISDRLPKRGSARNQYFERSGSCGTAYRQYRANFIRAYVSPTFDTYLSVIAGQANPRI